MRKLLLLLFVLYGSSLIASDGRIWGPACDQSWWGSVEFLYWKAFEGGFEYADSFDPLTGDLSNANSYELGFDFDAGFRLEAGYFCEENGWDIACNFTYYYTHPQDEVSGVLFPTLNYFGSVQGGAATNVAVAEANWHLHFNYFDIDLGKPLWFGCRFALHPHFGVRGAWINQNGEVIYSGGAITTGPFFIDLKNDFWGAGLKTGMHSRYLLNPYWSLVSDLSTSLLWGHFDIEQRQKQGGVSQINLQENIKRLIPTLQFAIGFAWEKEICWRCPLLLIFSAMAEAQYWWRQNQIQRFVDSAFPIHVRNSEDLGLFGLTFKGNLYF